MCEKVLRLGCPQSEVLETVDETLRLNLQLIQFGQRASEPLRTLDVMACEIESRIDNARCDWLPVRRVPTNPNDRRLACESLAHTHQPGELGPLNSLLSVGSLGASASVATTDSYEVYADADYVPPLSAAFGTSTTRVVGSLLTDL